MIMHAEDMFRVWHEAPCRRQPQPESRSLEMALEPAGARLESHIRLQTVTFMSMTISLSKSNTPEPHNKHQRRSKARCARDLANLSTTSAYAPRQDLLPPVTYLGRPVAGATV